MNLITFRRARRDRGRKRGKRLRNKLLGTTTSGRIARVVGVTGVVGVGALAHRYHSAGMRGVKMSGLTGKSRSTSVKEEKIRTMKNMAESSRRQRQYAARQGERFVQSDRSRRAQRAVVQDNMASTYAVNVRKQIRSDMNRLRGLARRKSR